MGGGGVALPSGGELHRGALRGERIGSLLPVAVVAHALHVLPHRLRHRWTLLVRQRAASQRVQQRERAPKRPLPAAGGDARGRRVRVSRVRQDALHAPVPGATLSATGAAGRRRLRAADHAAGTAPARRRTRRPPPLAPRRVVLRRRRRVHLRSPATLATRLVRPFLPQSPAVPHLHHAQLVDTDGCGARGLPRPRGQGPAPRPRGDRVIRPRPRSHLHSSVLHRVVPSLREDASRARGSACQRPPRQDRGLNYSTRLKSSASPLCRGRHRTIFSKHRTMFLQGTIITYYLIDKIHIIFAKNGTRFASCRCMQ